MPGPLRSGVVRAVNFTLEQLKAGEDAAWEEAYACFYALIVNVLGSRFNDVPQGDLEDVAIEAITKLINKCVETAESIEELKRLVVEIAKNHLRDLLSKQKTAKRGGGEVDSLEAQPEGTQFKSGASTPAEHAVAAERAFLVNEAVSQLPEKYREVVQDFYFRGLKQQEIADQRGLKIGSIGVYLSRGMEALEPILKNMELL